MILPIYGKGSFLITVSRIQPSGGSKLGIIFGGFKVKDLQYELSLFDINVKFEGLLGEMNSVKIGRASCRERV